MHVIVSRTMMVQLPSNLNWQTGFLKAFHQHFPRLTEADKWYMLAATHLSERDALSVWPAATTFAQLDELLLCGRRHRCLERQ